MGVEELCKAAKDGNVVVVTRELVPVDNVDEYTALMSSAHYVVRKILCVNISQVTNPMSLKVYTFCIVQLSPLRSP